MSLCGPLRRYCGRQRMSAFEGKGSRRRTLETTLLTVTSNVFGTVRPSALAVLRSTVNLEFGREHEPAQIILLYWSDLESASRHKVADRNDAMSCTMWRSQLASGTHRAARRARHRIARANRQKSGSATGLANCDRRRLIRRAQAIRHLVHQP